jgi:hypothetical protein
MHPDLRYPGVAKHVATERIVMEEEMTVMKYKVLYLQIPRNKKPRMPGHMGSTKIGQGAEEAWETVGKSLHSGFVGRNGSTW